MKTNRLSKYEIIKSWNYVYRFKSLILFCSAMILMLSCSGDEDEIAPNEINTPIVTERGIVTPITKIITGEENGFKSIYNFVYNKKNQLIGTADEDGQITLIQQAPLSYGSTIYGHTILSNFEFDSNGLVVSYFAIEQYICNLKYDSNLQLVELSYQDRTVKIDRDNNGNIILISDEREYEGEKSVDLTYFYYDSKVENIDGIFFTELYFLNSGNICPPMLFISGLLGRPCRYLPTGGKYVNYLHGDKFCDIPCKYSYSRYQNGSISQVVGKNHGVMLTKDGPLEYDTKDVYSYEYKGFRNTSLN